MVRIPARSAGRRRCADYPAGDGCRCICHAFKTPDQSLYQAPPAPCRAKGKSGFQDRQRKKGRVDLFTVRFKRFYAENTFDIERITDQFEQIFGLK